MIFRNSIICFTQPQTLSWGGKKHHLLFHPIRLTSHFRRCQRSKASFSQINQFKPGKAGTRVMVGPVWSKSCAYFVIHPTCMNYLNWCNGWKNNGDMEMQNIQGIFIILTLTIRKDPFILIHCTNTWSCTTDLYTQRNNANMHVQNSSLWHNLSGDMGHHGLL